MWHKIFIEDKFINYFDNESNIFTVTKNDRKVLAPTFSEFADIVNGVTLAWTMPWLPISEIEKMASENPGILRGFTFCTENKSSQNDRYLPELWCAIPVGQNESPYDVDTESLNAEQCAVLLMYPFWSRMGGSFEISFQEDGLLKKYLLALKKKIGQVL